MLFKPFFCLLLCALLTPPLSATPQKADDLPLSIITHPAQPIDPALPAFVRQVWQQSPLVQAAQASIKAAQIRAEGANKPLHNPTLELGAERTNSNTATIGLSQTLDWSNKQGALSQIANRQLQTAVAERQAIRQRLSAETLYALARHFTAEKMLILSQRRGQLMRKFIHTVKQRQAAGDMAALDVTLAQVVYSEALMTQATRESELAEADAALQAVSGLSMKRWPQLPAQLSAPPKQADATLLLSMPQLIVLRSRMEIANAHIQLAQREGRIDPTIGIHAGREDSETLLGLSIEIPLFIRNNYSTSTHAAVQEALAEELTFRDANQRASAHLSGALARFKHTSQAWQTWVSTGHQAHREQRVLLEQMWQTGELSSTDFVIHLQQNIDTQAVATTLMGEVWQAAIAWLEASGQIDLWLGLDPEQASHSIETNSRKQR